MNSKLLTIIYILFLIQLPSCSFFKEIVYSPVTNQGNYISSKEIDKIHIGMNKKEIENILGAALLRDSFESNTWYYVSLRIKNNRIFDKKIFILSFNNKNILIKIEKNLHN